MRNDDAGVETMKMIGEEKEEHSWRLTSVLDVLEASATNFSQASIASASSIAGNV